MGSGVDEGEQDVARDFAEVHPGDELLEGLEAGVDRFSVEFVVEWGGGKCGALEKCKSVWMSQST